MATAYTEGSLLRFDPFHFKNGAQSKPKYFVVLKLVNDTLLLASLPTSKDHVPATIMVSQGCVNDPERDVNAFIFSANSLVTSTFSFPRTTFIYAEQVDEYEATYLNSMNSVVTNLGEIESFLFASLIECLRNSKTLKRKYRRQLENLA